MSPASRRQVQMGRSLSTVGKRQPKTITVPRVRGHVLGGHGNKLMIKAGILKTALRGPEVSTGTDRKERREERKLMTKSED